MQENRLELLFERFIQQTCSPEEEIELMRLLVDPNLRQKFEYLVDAVYDQAQINFQMEKVQADQVFDRILVQSKTTGLIRLEKPSFSLWKKLAVAACLTILLGIGALLIFTPNKKSQPGLVQNKDNDIAAPATVKATILLSDGRKIVLDSFQTGLVGMEKGVKVEKNANGEVVYAGNADNLVYNTLVNPRGSMVVNLSLNDGTRVWLNAGSSIHYPVAFPADQRNVTITGECYFEVTKDPKRKFIVSGNGINIEVHGTHFNVNSYPDENTINVTLLEGSIAVGNPTDLGQSAVISPGQQARLSKAGRLSVVDRVDIEQVMAWKNGLFRFEEAQIETIMRQLNKWYDVQVEYRGNVSSHFVARIPRTVSVKNVFKILEQTGGVHFKIEGNKVIVMP